MIHAINICDTLYYYVGMIYAVLYDLPSTAKNNKKWGLPNQMNEWYNDQ